MSREARRKARRCVYTEVRAIIMSVQDLVARYERHLEANWTREGERKWNVPSRIRDVKCNVPAETVAQWELCFPSKKVIDSVAQWARSEVWRNRTPYAN